MSTLYLAIDPGKTTGVAWYDTRSGEFGSLEIEGRYKLYEYLQDDWRVPPNILVVEDWTVRGDTHRFSRQDDPHRIIGALDAWAWHEMFEMRLQTPGQAKSFATNDKLRALGWFSGGEGHADDAARHLLVALVKDRVPEILGAIT